MEDQVYDATFGTGDNAITVATGSLGIISILGAFAEPFAEENNARINWIRRGSGAALRELKTGNVDMVMVHAPAVEERAVKEGWAVHRTLFGGNEFYIVGPVKDSANIRDAKSAKDVYARIAAAESKFFSRGDDSGTHKREMSIWASAGIEPEGNWYVITNDFMTPALMRAEAEVGYLMVDSSTFHVNQDEIQNLAVLFKGDPVLLNAYHALVACQEKYPDANYALASKFVEFIGSPAGQQIIREYGIDKYGTALYKCVEDVKRLSD